LQPRKQTYRQRIHISAIAFSQTKLFGFSPNNFVWEKAIAGECSALVSTRASKNKSQVFGAPERGDEFF
jgi:hypothetical protein